MGVTFAAMLWKVCSASLFPAMSPEDDAVSPEPRAKKHDPYTDAEKQKLKDVGPEHPQKRIDLFIGFAQSRLDAVDVLRSAPKPTTEHEKHKHDLLEDFTSILDDLNDQLD